MKDDDFWPSSSTPTLPRIQFLFGESRQDCFTFLLVHCAMGNIAANGNAMIRRDRRRELTIVFYFIFGFIMIRIWILLIESHDILIEVIGGIVTFLLITVLYIRYRMQRNQQLEEEERLRGLHPEVNSTDLALLQALFRTPQLGLSQDVINSLYFFKYSEETASKLKSGENTEIINISIDRVGPDDCTVPTATGDLESQTTTDTSVPSTCCSICLAEYALEDDLMRLPCRHAYHKTCVSEWLQRHTQCPLCKQDVLSVLEQQLVARRHLDRLRGVDTHNYAPADNEEVRSSESAPVTPYQYAAVATPAASAPTAGASTPTTPNTPLL